jgi:hypothetical protein
MSTTVPRHRPVDMAVLVAELGFVLAIDGCARRCQHCPAFGSTGPARRADLDQLTVRLESLARARHAVGLPATPGRTMHCWRISDPLDYWWRTTRDGTATAADLALVWRDHLHQALYVVTNGSEGHPAGRRALATFGATPALVSQLKLTITPADRSWATPRYVDDLAADMRSVLPLWELPAARPEAGDGAARLRLNVKTTPGTLDEARHRTTAILRAAGLAPSAVDDAIADPRRVVFKPIYNLGTATGAPSPIGGAIDVTDLSGQRHKPTPHTRAQWQYGIRPDGRLFVVDMYAFTETELADPTTGQPLFWDQALRTVTDA